jgi:hypothetical protein
MAATNADDSMGVAVETPNAEEDDISDIENEFDYPSPAEVNVACVAYPSWLVDTRNEKSAGRFTRSQLPPMGAWLLTTSCPSVKPQHRNPTQTRPRG